MKHDDNNSDDEPGLWDRVTQDITPLKGRARTKTTEKAKPPQTTRVRQTPLVKTPPKPVQSEKSRDIDTRTRQRLERGQMPIDAVLDLHGCNQIQAHDQLIAFITRAYQQKLRCLLVITGKNRDSQTGFGKGVLKARLPEWVDETPLRHMVLKASAARARHGGDGAFYILLRRQMS